MPDERGSLVGDDPDVVRSVVRHVDTVGPWPSRRSARPRRLRSTRAAWVQSTREVVWRLVVTTVSSCLRYRVTGLAAEAAFFAVLSVPPLIFALAGAIGYVTDRFTPAAGGRRPHRPIIDLSERALTESAVNRIIVPTIDDVLKGGRFDVISLGFVLALWSGSRALNVFVDTITIMHGLGGHRGIVKTRALSFALYVLAMLTGVVYGPARGRRADAGVGLAADPLRLRHALLLAHRRGGVHLLPRHALPRVGAGADQLELQPPRRHLLPGRVDPRGPTCCAAFLTATAADSKSIYGPLSAPIAVLVWLYLVAIAVLIGAAVNAAFDTVFPQKATTRARLELVQRLRSIAVRDRPS